MCTLEYSTVQSYPGTVYSMNGTILHDHDVQNLILVLSSCFSTTTIIHVPVLRVVLYNEPIVISIVPYTNGIRGECPLCHSFQYFPALDIGGIFKSSEVKCIYTGTDQLFLDAGALSTYRGQALAGACGWRLEGRHLY